MFQPEDRCSRRMGEIHALELDNASSIRLISRPVRTIDRLKQLTPFRWLLTVVVGRDTTSDTSVLERNTQVQVAARPLMGQV